MRAVVRAVFAVVMGTVVAGCGALAPARSNPPSVLPPSAPSSVAPQTQPSATFSIAPSQPLSEAPSGGSSEPSGEPGASSPVPASGAPSVAPTQSPGPGASARPTPVDISALLTAEIDLVHVGDATIHVTVVLSDAGSGSSGSVAAFDLATLDSATQSVPPDTYTITFTRASSATGTSCTIDLRDGQHVEFISSDASIGVIDSANPPTTRADLLIASSPLCGQPAPT